MASSLRRSYLPRALARKRGELRASKPPKLFISYAELDRDYALDVAKALKNAGVSVWFDEWELFPGDNWAATAGNALEVADGLVLVISRAALESKWLRRDAQYAVGHERFQNRTFVVLAEEIPEGDRPPWFRYVASIDMVGRPREEAMKDVVDTVRRSEQGPRAVEHHVR